MIKKAFLITPSIGIVVFILFNSQVFAGTGTSYKTGYAYDVRCTTFYQNSSEVPQRAIWIQRRLEEQGLVEKMVKINPIEDPMVWIQKVHSQDHINGIKSIPVDSAHGATKPVGEIADLAAAYVLGAVRDVCEGKVNNAFAAIRPPGHHVTNSGSLVGFCAYANVVIAARYAQEIYTIKRILFIDWDYHYGNGTEFFIGADTNCFLVEFGSSDDSSSQANSKKVHIVTRNVGNGTNDEYENVFRNYLVPKMAQFSPELIIISCGFDLKKNDGLGSYSVTAQGISRLTKILMQIADQYCKGKIVSILEGGYYDRGSSPNTFYGLSQCAENHVRTLLSGEIQPETPFFKDSKIDLTKELRKPKLFQVMNKTLYFHPSSSAPEKILLYNILGEQIWSKRMNRPSEPVHLGDNWACTMYIIRIEFANGNIVSSPVI
ncbi:MAG: histone deacetylase, partial [Chitinivibrionales bacterium]|nr:histone deacetylase [Chitinivibrionales bacterium]